MVGQAGPTDYNVSSNQWAETDATGQTEVLKTQSFQDAAAGVSSMANPPETNRY